MATIATVADVLEAVETDLPDAVLQRMLDTAEDDVRNYLTATARDNLPVVVWSGHHSPTLGVADGSLTVPASVRSYPIIRIEGTVVYDEETPAFTADTQKLAKDESGAEALTPVTRGGVSVAAGRFEIEVDDAGTELGFDTTDTTAAVVITRILGLQQANPPPQWVSASLDLVELAVRYKGIDTERVGQYSVTLSDYHRERARVLGRVVYTSAASLAS